MEVALVRRHLHFFSLLFIGSTRAGTQVFVFAGQVLYNLSGVSIPFYFGHFEDRVFCQG
jgi:hypothetical protein